MARENGRNNKREQNKTAKLQRLLGVDLCACGGGHKMKCSGVCKQTHTNPETKQIECVALYQIDSDTVKKNNSRRPRRTWKYGRQKDIDENQQTKQQRREKFERDRN